MTFQFTKAAAEDPTLTRVALSTGGLGYFEYETQVEGDAEVALSVPLDQVDDVLKSLVVYDDAGRIGAVSLAGRQPLAEVFKSLPFDRAALASPAALLRSLAGAEITVSGPQETAGRILSVVEEQREDEAGRVSTATRVTLMGNPGLSQFVLEQSREIAFADPALQENVQRALVAMAKHGERGRRVLTLSAPGEGKRHLRVAYVAGVPLWKTSYRLTLPEASGSAGLQGWAVLENQSGEDWDRVELSLVSGSPVAFRQALYRSYYLDRPEIPVQVVDRILPPLDRVGFAEEPQVQADRGESDDTLTMYSPSPQAALAETPAEAEILLAHAQEGGSQAIYRFPEAVTVEDGHSLLVPFLDRRLPVERLSFYRPGVSGHHPLASLRLTNDSGISLPPGIATLYERGAEGRVSYLGDAQLALVPPDQSRLVSFALDAKVTVDLRDRQQQTVTGVSLKDGVLIQHERDLAEQVYAIKGAPDADRVMLLQLPLRPGWTLTGPKIAEETGAGYRLSVPLKAGESCEVAVSFERPLDQRFLLADADERRLAYLIDAQFVPESMKKQLAALSVKKTGLTVARRRLKRLENEEREIVADQDRLRDNLAAVPGDSDLGRRYLRQLSGQEDRLEQLRSQRKSQTAAVEDAERSLRDFLTEMQG